MKLSCKGRMPVLPDFIGITFYYNLIKELVVKLRVRKTGYLIYSLTNNIIKLFNKVSSHLSGGKPA
jgi:hypothetical protein